MQKKNFRAMGTLKIELIYSSRGHYLMNIPLTRRQNDPGLEIVS